MFRLCYTRFQELIFMEENDAHMHLRKSTALHDTISEETTETIRSRSRLLLLTSVIDSSRKFSE